MSAQVIVVPSCHLLPSSLLKSKVTLLLAVTPLPTGTHFSLLASQITASLGTVSEPLGPAVWTVHDTLNGIGSPLNGFLQSAGSVVALIMSTLYTSWKPPQSFQILLGVHTCRCPTRTTPLGVSMVRRLNGLLRPLPRSSVIPVT